MDSDVPVDDASARLARFPDRQTRIEELANSLSHGLVLLAACFAVPLLVVAAVRRGEPGFLIGSTVFGATVILLYLASTVYHALPPGRAKRVLRTVDHAAIYLLIAGTYTPFTLGALRGPWGFSLLAVVWTLAAIGLVVKLLGRLGGVATSTALYLAMGWLALIALEPLSERVPLAGLAWLFGGGLAYTAGTAFFVLGSRMRFGHAAWHGLSGLGTTCHFVAVLYAA